MITTKTLMDAYQAAIDEMLKTLQDNLEGKTVKIIDVYGTHGFYNFRHIRRINYDIAAGMYWMVAVTDCGTLSINIHPFLELALSKTRKYEEGGQIYELLDEDPRESEIKEE